MRQKLGQHFLKNQTVLEHIVDAFELRENDSIIEIGPGHGELTNVILKKKFPLSYVGIERDETLFKNLSFGQEKFSADKKIKFLFGNALDYLASITKDLKTSKDSYKLVGNIPYYITGHLFRVISELSKKPSVAVFTIQKEVAKRAIAIPPDMNLLAASLGVWADVKIIEIVPKKDFYPKPEVDSAILKLVPRTDTFSRLFLKNYYLLIKILFKQPRKTIVNNLKEGEWDNMSIQTALASLSLSSNSRAQNLEITDIVQLTKILYTK